MRILKTLLLVIFLKHNLIGQNGNSSLTYAELLKNYQRLDSTFEEAKLFTYGNTDCGEPLRLFVISKNKIFDAAEIHKQEKCLLFINNGIHPGEPDGMDASLMLSESLLGSKLPIPDNVVIGIIPVFNIDGALNRGCCSRINQNGPEEYGFRANGRNLDLNRDFVKADTRNTKELMKIIRHWDPDVFIDTHVSNGADYQYTMTLIQTQHNKLNEIQGNFLKNEMTPFLYEEMKKRNDEMTPYVQTMRNASVPDSGIVAFLETPRYLTGYLSLFNTISYISETHMLKPFSDRVKSTLNLLEIIVDGCSKKCNSILGTRKKANAELLKQKYYHFNWTCDYSQKENLDFKGFKASIIKSEVTGDDRLYYDRSSPHRKVIPFFNEYKSTDSILIPKYFFIPYALEEVIHLLEINRVEFISIDKDSAVEMTVTYVEDFKTVKDPYEGHYLHYDVKTRNEKQVVDMRKKDLLIPLPQKNMKYLLETLVPRAIDSYFCWNFFDSFLQQKEWFSDYVYEDIAADNLKKDKNLRADFEKWKSENPGADNYTQLNFIYQRSNAFDKGFMRLPVFMIY